MMYFSRVSIHPHFFKSGQYKKTAVNDCYGVHQLLWKLFGNEKKRIFLYREEIAREQFGARAGIRGEPVYYLVSAAPPVTDNTVFQVEERKYQPKLQVGDILQFDLRANPVITRNGKKHDVVMDARHSLLVSLAEKYALQQYLPAVPQKKHYQRAIVNHGGKGIEDELTHIVQDNRRYAERLRDNLNLRDKLNLALRVVADQALEKWLIKKGRLHGFQICQDGSGCYKLQNTGYCWRSLVKKTRKKKRNGFSSVDFTGEIEVTDRDKFLTALFTGIGRSKAFGCGLMLVKRR